MARFTHAGAVLSLVVSVLFFAVASHAAVVIPAHGNVAKRHTVPAQFEATNATEHDLTKRYTVDHSKWTYYDAGKGACGGTNKGSDWIVALDAQKFDSGNWCWKSIELFYNGKSAKAQIVDRVSTLDSLQSTSILIHYCSIQCEGCGSGNLDLTTGLFSYFDSLDKGVLYGSYNA
ncbi:hypothetical protein BDY19DRAFT_306927 [Irpex rosettiformis]|uniref:Uncharacterized protein n=1 Tax=Irpex rosettiformis TaxID=378272 RepID=A0ACB8TZ13_9APHY|nr:hypothetical protein BDY19DRAFT_306927 [Irpex rosettiformis]